MAGFYVIPLSFVQALALFAFFDDDYSGEVGYEEFGRLAMLPNPKGGTAVYPKPITTTADRLLLETKDKDETKESGKTTHKTTQVSFHQMLNLLSGEHDEVKRAFIRPVIEPVRRLIPFLSNPSL